MLPPGRRNQDPLKRRRRTVGGIKFYDLAWFADGSEIAYKFPVALSYGSGSPNVTVSNNPSLTEYTAQADEIFSYAIADWETTFKRITSTMLRTAYYHFRYLDDATTPYLDSNDLADTSWNNDELALPESAATSTNIEFGFMTGAALPGWSFAGAVKVKGSSPVKWTTTRNYAASGVTYTPAGGDVWFLLPVLNYPRSLFSGSPPIRHEWYFDSWQKFPRAAFSDPASANYDAPLLASWNTGPITNGDGYPGVFRLLNLFKAAPVLSSPIGIRTTIPFSSYSHAIIDPTTVPDAVYWPPGGPGPKTTAAFSQFFQQTSIPTGGRLSVVVKQGSNYFYGWH